MRRAALVLAALLVGLAGDMVASALQTAPGPVAGQVEAPAATSFRLKAWVRAKVNRTVGVRGWSRAVRLRGCKAIARALDAQVAAAPGYPQDAAGFQKWVDDTKARMQAELGADYPAWSALVLHELGVRLDGWAGSGRIQNLADEVRAVKEAADGFRSIDR